MSKFPEQCICGQVNSHDHLCNSNNLKPLKRWSIVLDINGGEFEEIILVEARDIRELPGNILMCDWFKIRFESPILRIYSL